MSQPGDLAKGLRIPRDLTLEVSGIWPQNLHRPRETDSWRAQIKPCVYQDPGERSDDPIRDWPRLACECPGVSSGGVGWPWPAAGSGTLSVAVHARDLLKEVAIIFIISTIVWSQVKQQGRNIAPFSKENWIKDLLSMAPPIRKRGSLDPHHQSLPSGSFHKLLIFVRGQTEWKSQSQKTNQTDHMDHSLV